MKDTSVEKFVTLVKYSKNHVPRYINLCNNKDSGSYDLGFFVGKW